jgi:hypothetical protein
MIKPPIVLSILKKRPRELGVSRGIKFSSLHADVLENLTTATVVFTW